MRIFSTIAENRIRQAQEEGQFDDLPNAGRPLEFPDEPLVPQELRLAYRVLRNAGFAPPELVLRQEVLSLRALIDAIDDDGERLKKIRELNYKLLRLNTMRRRHVALEDVPSYGDRVVGKLL